jgi:two-component system cell cycle response regulator CpdR
MTTSGRDGAAGDTAGSGRLRATHHPVLVVDDDPLIVALVTRLLRSHGAEVVGAAGGREALRTLYTHVPAPSVLLTDVDMAGMSGIELAARVTADRPAVVVVLMTGDPETRDEARRRPELVHAVLLKPFELDELLDVVDDAMATFAAREPKRSLP